MVDDMSDQEVKQILRKYAMAADRVLRLKYLNGNERERVMLEACEDGRAALCTDGSGDKPRPSSVPPVGR